MSIQIKQDLTVVVRVPQRTSNARTEAFIKEHEDWINLHLADMMAKKRRSQLQPRLSGEELQGLADQAAAVIPGKVRYYADLIGVTYGRITIRNQKTRWGSCSSAGNLNFNCLLMLAPENVQDYVIVHELCHRIEMNHSRAFWTQVERILPDYRVQKKWLKDHGMELMQRN